MSHIDDNTIWQDEPVSWNTEAAFDPSDPSSDGIEEDGTMNADYLAFWRGDD